MKKLFSDLPNWVFDVEEISSNVYEVTGVDTVGHRVQIKGADLDGILQSARQGARKIEIEIFRR